MLLFFDKKGWLEYYIKSVICINMFITLCLKLPLPNFVSRLLVLAARFATKMIRKYGLLQYNGYPQGGRQLLSLPSVLPDKVQTEVQNSQRLQEMAHFLEIIRNLQSRLSSKFKRPGQGSV